MTRLLTYNNSGDTAPTNSGTVTVDSSIKFEGANSLRYDTTTAYSEWNFGTTTVGRAYYVRTYIRFSALTAGTQATILLLNTSSAICGRLIVNASGQIRILNSAGSFVGATSGALEPNYWNLVEWKVQQNATAANGTMAFRINGIVEQTDTAIDLTNVAINRWRFGRPANSETPTFWHDAIAINDDQGAGPDNTYVGGTLPDLPAANIVNPNGKRRLQIPIGISQVNNSQMRAANDRWALRFVTDSAFTLQRFITGFNLEGVYTDGSNVAAPTEIRTQTSNKQAINSGYSPTPSGLPGGWSVGTGRIGYAHGNGGTIRARLVTANADGTPNMSNVLATESFNPVDRYIASKTYFGYVAGGPMPFLYIDFGGVSLSEDTMYFVVLDNTHGTPLDNYVSPNTPTAPLAAGGPHRVNTLSKYTVGAVAGLDPRESIWWSIDSGSNWVQGEKVGGDMISSGMNIDRPGGHIFAYYSGLDVPSDEAVRLPWYGYELPAGASTRKAIQPYYNYLSKSTGGRMVCRKCPRVVSFTTAGGLAATGDSVGVITVKNENTGVTATTSSLGTGLVSGALSQAVPVGIGQTFSISASGTVYRCESDVPLVTVFGLGSGDWPFTTDGQANDRLELYAS
jgi:hypothetical protein